MHILFLLNSDIRQEQRINKEIQSLLKAGHSITLAYLPSEPRDSTDNRTPWRQRPLHLWTRTLPKNRLFWLIKYAEVVARFIVEGLWAKPDAVHCVDRLTLLPGYLIARFVGVPCVYDTQELWPEVRSALNRPRWLWLWLERSLARRTYRVLVTDHFRLKLTAEVLKLDIQRMSVLMNLPYGCNLDGASGRGIRTESGFLNKKLVVYAGALSAGRHLEESVEALRHLPDEYALAFVGFGTGEYSTGLMNLAKHLGVSDRFVLLPGVRWSVIPEYIRSADCALAFYEKLSINNLYCSPSKLFDALIAGVPVVGTDNPLIVEVLTALDAGETVSQMTPLAIAEAVAKLITRKSSHLHHVDIASRALKAYTWERQEDVLANIYGEMERIP